MYISNGLIQLKINGVQTPTDVPYTSKSGRRLSFILCLIFSALLKNYMILQTSLKIEIILLRETTR